MTTKKSLVMDALENLSKENFKRFVKALEDRRGNIRVAKNKLQDKDFMDVTDVLVSAFTEDKTPAVVSELLWSIKCADEAEKLDEQIAKHFPKSSASKAAAAAAGAAGETTCSSEEHFVDKHRTKLIERVTNIDPILNRLLEKKVIQDSAYEKIRDTRGDQQKMIEIYRLALKSGIRAKDIFFEILKEQHLLLVEDLEKKA
ncbi:apoptosis-associated speck-like protein containing a CARD isoform X2 [Syngnathus scovelli]|uniref:apoptosis-associated speck-like protein containing a CARD isoform X2 n=1 Tax=Syngnathus scovelli TaxID=161590 RepID=UPI00210FDA68|nr:apoptosis-associated speck-like protein containing a CARD isoform X2 [Syngnathus scovelli]